MQEDNFIPNENTPDSPGRHRPRPGRRTRHLIVAAVALSGLGLGGVAVAATTGADEPAVPAAAIDAQARAEAADRADRSARESSAPTTPSASPASPTPRPSTASPSAKPSPRATTAKPRPKKTAKPKPT